MKDISEKFLDLAFNSGKWKKWILDISTTSDREKAILAGHYIFSTSECSELINYASEKLAAKDLNLRHYLKESIKTSICRYLRNFRLI